MGLVGSVVIPVHNAEATLGDQLTALASQIGAPDFEVIVVLNRCTDRSQAVAESFASRLHLVLICTDEKASAAYARNMGATRSAAPYLLFCDADDRVSERWVAEMIHTLATGEADFIGGCPVVDRENLPGWAYEWFYRDIDGPKLMAYAAIRVPISASLGITRR